MVECLNAIRLELERVTGDAGEAEFELRQLLGYVLNARNICIAQLRGALSAEQEAELWALVERRKAHEPLQYILGEWEFMGLPFLVNESVLIPRQDTELVAELAEELIEKRGYKMLLDICTGSGCVGVSLARRTGIHTVLADISERALALAAANAELNSVCCKIVKSDLFAEIDGSFDIITANPPYICSHACDNLQPEVMREPRLALDGGRDGLDFYRRIHEDFIGYLNPGGVLILEIGFDQGRAVPALFADCGNVSLHRDICGVDRVVMVERLNCK